MTDDTPEFFRTLLLIMAVIFLVVIADEIKSTSAAIDHLASVLQAGLGVR